MRQGNGEPHSSSEGMDGDETEQWLAGMASIMMGESVGNGSRDHRAPVLKSIVRNTYPIFVLQYGLLMLVGAVVNVLIGYHVMRTKLYRDVTHGLVLNLVLSHCVQCFVVVPMTLTVLLVQNWVLGQFLCYFLPMLQDIPLHVCMITHLLIAWDRMRWLSDPLKCRLPAFVCSCATWLAGIVITLPYPIYINYMDLGTYLKEFEGVDFCTVNLVDDMHEYMRGLFITMYCAPAIVLSYLYIRTSRELRPPDGPLGVMLFEARAEARNRQSSGSQFRPYKEQALNSCSNALQAQRSYDLYDAELDLSREKKTQRYLCSMAAVQVICISPLMVLRLARLVLEETYDNSGHFDLTFLMFVWMAFLPTVINPWIYATWVLSRPTMDRLRGYLRLSTKRRTSSSTSQPEEKEGDSEGGPRGRASSTRHSQKKRTSETSALTTVSSVRSTTTKAAEVDAPVRVLRIQRTPSKVSTANMSSSSFGYAEDKHFQFPPPAEILVSSGSSSINRLLQPETGPGIHAGDEMSIQSSISNLAETSSNLERDLEIIDLLERERSMDIQQSLERERQELGVQAVAERRRQLPSVARQGHSRRNFVTDKDQSDLLFTTTRPEYAMVPKGKSSNERRSSTRHPVNS